MARRRVPGFGRGRAWGNALGGWRKQARNPRGQFASGSGGARSARRSPARKSTAARVIRTSASAGRTARATNRRSATRVSHGKNLPLKSVPKYTDAQYARAVRSASSYKYTKKELNPRIQKMHLHNTVAVRVGEYGGQAGAMAIAGATMGPIGATLVGTGGGIIGKAVAEHSLKQQGIYIGPKQFLAMGKGDQAAIVQREARLDTLDFMVNAGFAAYSVHRSFQRAGSYARWANTINSRKASRVKVSTRGLPRAGMGSRGSFAPKRAPRYGPNKGVYNITTGGSTLRRAGTYGGSGFRIR